MHPFFPEDAGQSVPGEEKSRNRLTLPVAVCLFQLGAWIVIGKDLPVVKTVFSPLLCPPLAESHAMPVADSGKENIITNRFVLEVGALYHTVADYLAETNRRDDHGPL